MQLSLVFYLCVRYTEKIKGQKGVGNESNNGDVDVDDLNSVTIGRTYRR